MDHGNSTVPCIPSAYHKRISTEQYVELYVAFFLLCVNIVVGGARAGAHYVNKVLHTPGSLRDTSRHACAVRSNAIHQVFLHISDVP
jgi:hypothetical protein